MAKRSSMTPGLNKRSNAGVARHGKATAAGSTHRGGGVNRSARTGQYVQPSTTTERPATNVQRATQNSPSASVSAEQRAAAARIRITYDQKRGHKTEGWIKRLARGA